MAPAVLLAFRKTSGHDVGFLMICRANCSHE
jgi:hypothetical protein